MAAEKIPDVFQKVTIEGDQYLLTVPECNMLDRFLDYCVRNRLAVDSKTPCYSWKKTYGAGPMNLRSILLVPHITGYPVTFEDHAGWRPMLVPLKQDGCPSSWFIRMKNGTVVRGGSLGCRESGRPSMHFALIEDMWDEAPVLTESDLRVDAPRIMDTQFQSDSNIPWVVWEGRLICSRILVRDISVNKLLQSRSISGLSHLGPDADALAI